jgi:aminoglycoside/choline kinase family phosphotransferase
VNALRPEIVDYLARTCPGARATRIEGDASARRFYRVTRADGSTRILMDYGSAFDGETDDVVVTRIFQDAGLRVAQIVDVVNRAGCLLLEDLGSVSLETAIAEGKSPTRSLFESAVRLAADVAVKGTTALAISGRSGGPALDAERFRFEMDFFLEHYAAGHLGRNRLPAGLQPALHELAERASETPHRVLCHRDFHSRNLMVLDDGELAMVDIQDARWGPEGYDLASLLYDAYVDLEAGWSDELIELYRSLAGTAAAPEEFRKRFDRLAAQRMIKALGTFGFQAHERGNPRYLSGVPRTLDRLRRVLPASGSPPGLFELMSEARLLG